jgi:hypothetical protein
VTATHKQDPEPEDDNGYEEEDDFTEENDIDSTFSENDNVPSESLFKQQDLWSEHVTSDIPEDIHQALRVKADVICKAIIQVLEKRPKFSSIRKKIPTYILKLWNIRTRGNPRKQFANRVEQQIAIMDRKGYVIVYKSKNERVKLGWVKYHDK